MGPVHQPQRAAAAPQHLQPVRLVVLLIFQALLGL